MPEAPQNQDQPKPEAKGLKSTLNLPQTTFPMKANLPLNEPARLAAWTAAALYEQIRAARAGSPKYILHDGPPYANGAIHLGHALNKCIKDFVVKTKTMAGFDAPYVPGWDCHGLPIEIKVDEQLGRKKLEMEPVAVRRACREYAQKYVDLQRSQFERLGILGRWNDPYLTMSFGYEASILETFYGFFEKGFVYKGLKPVFWCIHDRTALAEAEVEYEQHTSPSVYVRYKLADCTKPLGVPSLDDYLLSLFNVLDDRYGASGVPRDIFAIIWTTTPWTIPASQAVAFNPDLDYVAVAAKRTDEATPSIYIVSAALKQSVLVICGLSEVGSSIPFKGSVMEDAKFQHPLSTVSYVDDKGDFSRTVFGVLAPYVTSDQGTGAVHTAPAHGVDDFATGRRYGLTEIQYVDNAGRQRNTDGQPYEGLTVFKSNAVIIELLRERGALLSATSFEHSYPHCWRCHNPVIVRATEQWFIGMETPMPEPANEAVILTLNGVKGKDPCISSELGPETTFRQRALDEIKRVTWDPAWGEERISNMIATRPDWCISRQRIWGVPIAVFLCEKCRAPLNDPAINQSIVSLFKKESADAWYIHSPADLLPPGTTCPCGGTEFRKEMDILDVWFESGSSWHAVLEAEPELTFPADLYTEGGDQHRGWFHSSLLNSVALRGVAPYRTVATSGWTLDEQGRAFSKSLGNGVDPVDVAKRLGGEIIRLWVASVDFREDVAASENLMQRVSDNYRKLRNTLRFLLGNLHDFTPSTDAIHDFAKLEYLDQYILTRLASLNEKVRAAYDAFEFHRAYHALNEFVNTDLSALYLDVVKDTLYTFAPNHPQRRSAQTVLWRIAEVITRLVAPILSFTADETWDLLPTFPGRESNVHLASFFEVKEIISGSVSEIQNDWKLLLELRDKVLKRLEAKRMEGAIGKALEAQVILLSPETSGDQWPIELIDKYKETLPQLFGTSRVKLKHMQGFHDLTTDQAIEVGLASGIKCARCWRYTDDVGSEANYPTVCLRCAEALAAIHFPPYSANDSAEGEAQ